MSASLERTTRILVVDDIESMRRLLTKNLHSMGYASVIQAANGREALHCLDNRRAIGVVITDWQMPVMSGIELLRAIRAHDKHKMLPVLMITAEIARAQVREAIEAGVSDFLVKPFTAGGLQSKIDRIAENLKRGMVAGLKMPKSGGPPGGMASAPAAKPSGSQAGVPRPVARRSNPGAEPPALKNTDELLARLNKQANILVVDDISDNIDVMAGLLRDEHKVRAATSGEMALKLLSSGKSPPDLILLDLMMPEMDGFEVCRRLKADPKTAGIPVIFLTAADDATNVVQGFELGAVDYLTKPVDPIVLKARVRNHLSRSRAFAELKEQNRIMAENVRLREEVERMTSHDLKNPIGGIINFTDMLLGDEAMTDDQKEMLRAVDDSAHSLLNMVNLSLDLFKMEQGTYVLQPSQIDLVQIVRKLLAEKTPEIGAKGLKLDESLRGSGARKGEEPAFLVHGDGLLCYSMIGNLIKNAVEASPDDGKLVIAFGRGSAGHGKVTITNNGVVPESIRASFFDKYVTAGKQGGTGLGTYSAMLLAQVQHGTIDLLVDDARNETTLTITLPLAA